MKPCVSVKNAESLKFPVSGNLRSYHWVLMFKDGIQQRKICRLQHKLDIEVERRRQISLQR